MYLSFQSFGGYISRSEIPDHMVTVSCRALPFYLSPSSVYLFFASPLLHYGGSWWLEKENEPKMRFFVVVVLKA